MSILYYDCLTPFDWVYQSYPHCGEALKGTLIDLNIANVLDKHLGYVSETGDGQKTL